MARTSAPDPPPSASPMRTIGDERLREALAAAAGGMEDDAPAPGEVRRLPGGGAPPPADPRPRHRARWVAAGVGGLVAVVGVAGLLSAPPARSPRPAAPLRVGSTTVAPPGTVSSGTAAGAAPSPSHGPAPGATVLPAVPARSPSAPTGSVPSLPAGAVGHPAEIEKSGSAQLVTRRSLGRAVAALTALAVADGGFVAGSSLQTGTGAFASVTLQVPESAFESVEGSLGSVGSVVALSSHATDVTGQYVDLQARITALQASEQQYLTIMTRAQTVGDILSVQSQLDQIQSQLEQLQGQQQELDSQTTYATLAVTVTQAGHHRHVPLPPVPASGLDRAWHRAVSGFESGVDGLVAISGPVLFLALLGLVLVLVGGTAWRAWRRRAR